MYIYMRETSNCCDEHGWLVVWLVVFYGISTLEDYSMPNPLYICICFLNE